MFTAYCEIVTFMPDVFRSAIIGATKSLLSTLRSPFLSLSYFLAVINLVITYSSHVAPKTTCHVRNLALLVITNFKKYRRKITDKLGKHFLLSFFFYFQVQPV